MSNDSWNRGGGWLGWFGMRAAGGETTTRETTTTSIETKVGIQVRAWAVIAFVAAPTTGFGAWLALDGLRRVMDWNLTDKDILFGLVVLGIVAVSITQATKDMVGKSSPTVRNLVGLLMGTLGVGGTIFLYGEVDSTDLWPAVRFLFGVGLLYASPLLIYRMSMVLRDPFGDLSPFEKRFLDIYEQERLDEEPEDEYVDLPIPARHAGNIRVTTKNPNENGRKQKLNPDIYLLAEFMRRGDRIGFTRPNWLKEGRKEFPEVKLRIPTHPNGPMVRITRGVYDHMVRMMLAYGWLAERGSGWEWADGVTLDIALEELQTEIDHLARQGVEV